jgi:hypothetical protein
MTNNKKGVQENATANRELTIEERALVEKYFSPGSKSERIKLTQDAQGRFIFTPSHPNTCIGFARLMEEVGCNDLDLLMGLLNQLLNSTLRDGKFDEETLNFNLSVVRGIKPKDVIEIMLAAQIVAIHDAVMRYTRQLALTKTMLEQENTERVLNKFVRTFTNLVEALKRHRASAAEQKVTLVSVAQGAQAIVGNVTHAPAGNGSETQTAAPEALNDNRALPKAVRTKTDRFRP